MVGLDIYHRLKQHDSVIWFKLSRRAVLINHAYFELDNLRPETRMQADNYREMADHLNLEVECIDPIIPGDTDADMISISHLSTIVSVRFEWCCPRSESLQRA